MFRDMQARVWVDAELLERVAAELSSSGYKVLPFDPAQPPDRGVLIVRHAERAEALAKERIKLAVIGVLDASELSYALCAVADFVLLEWFPGELAARVARLSKQDAPGYRVHLLARAVEYAGDIIELGTTKAVLQYVNPAYTRVLGVSASDAEGKTPAQLVRSGVHPPEFFKEIDRTLSAGRVWSGRLISRNTRGELVYLDTTLAPVTDESGQVSHHVAVRRGTAVDAPVPARREQGAQPARPASPILNECAPCQPRRADLIARRVAIRPRFPHVLIPDGSLPDIRHARSAPLRRHLLLIRPTRKKTGRSGPSRRWALLGGMNSAWTRDIPPGDGRTHRLTVVSGQEPCHG